MHKHRGTLKTKQACYGGAIFVCLFFHILSTFVSESYIVAICVPSVSHCNDLVTAVKRCQVAKNHKILEASLRDLQKRFVPEVQAQS